MTTTMTITHSHTHSHTHTNTHSYPTNGKDYTDNPRSLAHLFDYYDAFVAEVNATARLAARLSPGTATVLDECGTLRFPPFARDPAHPQSGPVSGER